MTDERTRVVLEALGQRLGPLPADVGVAVVVFTSNGRTLTVSWASTCACTAIVVAAMQQAAESAAEHEVSVH